jgi:magnesium chelatase family protein
MTLAKVACRGQIGLHAPLVQVEVSLGAGLPAFSIVGLPATVVKESKERVRAAILHSGFEFPAGRITVNLAPAELPKEGGRFDLPIALGILIASDQVKPLAGMLDANGPIVEFYGELGLSGELWPTRGLVLAAAHANQAGHELIVPRVSAPDALTGARTPVRAATHLREVCAHVEGKTLLEPVSPTGAECLSQDGMRSSRGELDRLSVHAVLDLRDIRGQSHAKSALAIAAAGSHSLLFIGPPGSGKSMLAQRLPGLLPPLTEAEALEVASIASASAVGFRAGEFGRRPFRSPHHTSSAAALVGGGSKAKPGEVSLAHHGVLFLDELPEFERRVLEALREPLEAGIVSISRASYQVQYPSAFQLIAAMNPCPCGRLGDQSGNCNCTPGEVQRYRSRISGPMLDRIDMHVEVPRVELSDFDDGKDPGESSESVASRVFRARATQMTRQGCCNARLEDSQAERWCRPDPAGFRVLELAMKRRGLSARGRTRVLKLARTIADLNGEEAVTASHVSQAVMLRCLDRRESGSAPGAQPDTARAASMTAAH